MMTKDICKLKFDSTPEAEVKTPPAKVTTEVMTDTVKIDYIVPINHLKTEIFQFVKKHHENASLKTITCS